MTQKSVEVLAGMTIFSFQINPLVWVLAPIHSHQLHFFPLQRNWL